MGLRTKDGGAGPRSKRKSPGALAATQNEANFTAPPGVPLEGTRRHDVSSHDVANMRVAKLAVRATVFPNLVA